MTSIVTALVTGADPAAPGSTGARTLNGANGGSSSFFNNTGAVAGVFVVVGLLAAGIVIGLGFFFVRRTKRRQLDEDIRVAAGGAGDGGAGINRFDDDEESIDGYAGQSDSHQSGYMSSLGAVPLTAAAAGFGTRRSSGYDLPTTSSIAGLATTTDRTSSFEPGNSPAQSQSTQFQPYGAGAAGYAAQNNEGIFADDWAEYVNAGGVAGLATSGEGSAGGPSSQEGMSACWLSLVLSLSDVDELLPQWARASRTQPTDTPSNPETASQAPPSTPRAMPTPTARKT